MRQALTVSDWTTGTGLVVLGAVGIETAELVALGEPLTSAGHAVALLTGALVAAPLAYTVVVRRRQAATARDLDDRVLKAVCQAQPYAMWLTSVDDGAVRYANPAAEALWEVEHGADTLARRIHADDRSAVRRSMADGAKTGWDLEYRIHRKSGGVTWIRDVAFPVPDARGRVGHMARMAHDITARKGVERELREAKSTAERTSRAKCVFLANMSHELRTPLNAILGFSEALLAEAVAPVSCDRQRSYLADIRSSGTHLLRMIEGILEFADMEGHGAALEETILRPDEILDRALARLAAEVEARRIRLSVDRPDDPPRLRADERKLVQMLGHLIGNAVDFTPDGGAVAVALIASADGGLAFEIGDRGVGMSAEDIAAVTADFGCGGEPYARQAAGFGLGLTLSRKMMDLHGGRLDIVSEPGRGTTVTITFPRERLVAG